MRQRSASPRTSPTAQRRRRAPHRRPTAYARAVRAQLLPQARPRYAGYVAWRGLADEHIAHARGPPRSLSSLRLQPRRARAHARLSGRRIHALDAAGRALLQLRVVSAGRARRRASRTSAPTSTAAATTCRCRRRSYAQSVVDAVRQRSRRFPVAAIRRSRAPGAAAFLPGDIRPRVCRAWLSAASRCLETPLSLRGRIAAWASPKPRATR